MWRADGNAAASASVPLRVFRKRALLAWIIGTIVLGVWWARFFTVPEYFQRTYELGWYPPDGDSIGIPIAGNGIATLFATPFFALALWLSLRRFPTRVRLLAWSDDRIGASLLWTATCALLCYFEITNLIEAVRLRLPLTFTVTLTWITIWILLRAILVSRAVEGVAGVPTRP
jgi:hypothetical protein